MTKFILCHGCVIIYNIKSIKKKKNTFNLLCQYSTIYYVTDVS